MTDQTMLSYFPLTQPRAKQVLALERTFVHAQNGIQDIVIAAPTGIGKTGIGAAICLWAGHMPEATSFKPGGYYLVTQKLLQDQITKDFPKFTLDNDRCASLKSAVEYPCPEFNTCMAGRKFSGDDEGQSHAHSCSLVKQGRCRYNLAKAAFNSALLSVTNYAYFFTERLHVKQFPRRHVLVADECHTLERQLMGFVEFAINKSTLEKWAPGLTVPKLPSAEEFVAWVKKEYLMVVSNRLTMVGEMLAEPDNVSDPRLYDDYTKLENHIKRIEYAIVDIAEQPANWVYWQEENGPYLESVVKPLFVFKYVPPLIIKPAKLRIYMSAYPGPKKVFCRSLGLDPAKVAWLNLNSTFPAANRPVHVLSVGSMGRRNYEATLPRLLRVTESILGAHQQEKGIIHCHSYLLGNALFSHLSGTKHASRILFARQAKDRSACLRRHIETPDATVLLSPSMAEGFSLDDDLARWQIIAKIPYPYLGDLQVSARKDIDPEWYILQTASTIIQACGRIVRSDTDYGTTYVLDKDFESLFENNSEFFPHWFQAALVWAQK